jgi:hypothetical protein
MASESGMSSLTAFRAPTPVERMFNRAFGFLVRIGLGFSYNYLLRVRGLRSRIKTPTEPIMALDLFQSVTLSREESLPPLASLL